MNIVLSNGMALSIDEAKKLHEELGKALRVNCPNRLRRADDALDKQGEKPYYDLKEKDDE